MVLDKLCSIYPNASQEAIRKDATTFYTSLASKGFIYWGIESDYANKLNQRFSYSNIEPYLLDIEEKQENPSTYLDTSEESII